jgi:hypothetical protein
VDVIEVGGSDFDRFAEDKALRVAQAPLLHHRNIDAYGLPIIAGMDVLSFGAATRSGRFSGEC